MKSTTGIAIAIIGIGLIWLWGKGVDKAAAALKSGMPPSSLTPIAAPAQITKTTIAQKANIIAYNPLPYTPLPEPVNIGAGLTIWGTTPDGISLIGSVNPADNPYAYMG